MRHIVLLGLLFLFGAASAAESIVAELADPDGDDHGSGALVYPQREGFAPGDLDLLSLRMLRGDDDYRFEATFRNPVRDPAKVPGDIGPEPLSYFARRGFYAFNVDLYLDLDRVAGSGNTYTLPGRGGLQLDPSTAWERAVVLTPRPELMRKQLINALADTEHARFDDVAQRIDGIVFFVTDVQVRGRTIAFSVPASFLDAGRPDSDWTVAALVTGAKTAIEADFDVLHASGAPIDRIALGAMQPEPGRPRGTLGYSGTVAPSPVVDLLASEPAQQALQLSGARPLAGVAWSQVAATPGDDGPGPVTRLTTVPAAPVAPPPAVAPRADIAERLRTLEGLRAQGLVSDDEYAQLRARILSEL
ncbi:MAG: glucodextranase DOMON-like domain-containing protein [Sinimarinibacterium sp.]|jgi:hypothetical protein